MKSLTLLGSTGSIGTTTLSIVRQHPEKFRIEAITGSNNVRLLIEQALEFRPRFVAIANEHKYPELHEALAGTGIATGGGDAAVLEAAAHPSDWTMAGIVGIAGLPPTLKAIERGGVLAIANKECMVSAGALVNAACARYGTTLLPVDSEHNAIFQVFEEAHPGAVEAVTLTASGGPFRQKSKEELRFVKSKDALAHPNWRMGAKVTIDSATLMNKGLEVIEAFHLFPVTARQIRVVVHPQSIIHSLVHYVDGSVLAQLSLPDMSTPIAYALYWPERLKLDIPRLDLAKIGALTFEEPDTERFPCLRLAREALEAGGTATAILNAANEVAVEAYLENRLRFTDIPVMIERTFAAMTFTTGDYTLEDVLETDRQAREIALTYLEGTPA